MNEIDQILRGIAPQPAPKLPEPMPSVLVTLDTGEVVPLVFERRQCENTLAFAADFPVPTRTKFTHRSAR